MVVRVEEARCPNKATTDHQCVAGWRIGSSQELRQGTSAWHDDVNQTQRGVERQMNIDEARTKLKFVYPKIKT